MMRPGAARLALVSLAAGAAGLLGGPGAAPSSAAGADPAFSVEPAALEAAYDCDDFTHPETEPVLLVHGTFTSGHEQWDWNYVLALRETGRDVCVVSYPDRGLGDQQISAEYVAWAIQRIAEESGRPVDMVGHSQGATMPRWAIKWWPSARAVIDDFVLIAGPNHGTSVVSGSMPTGQPPAFFQFSPQSDFIRALNAGDETPGDVDYTTIYTAFDEVVRPVDPPTAALDHGLDDPRVANILIQDLCPARVVDHLTIGTTDRLSQLLTIDALAHDGPADVDRVAPDEVLCNLPDQFIVPETVQVLLLQLPSSFADGFPQFEMVTEEPPLRDYALADEPAPAAPAATPSAAPAPQTPGSQDVTAPAGQEPGTALPQTGRAIPLVAAGVAIGIALLLRAGRSRLDDAPPDEDTDADG